MLVLTRNMNESIIINGDISVKIISINGSQVRLGIEAQKHVSVHREEIYKKIQSSIISGSVDSKPTTAISY